MGAAEDRLAQELEEAECKIRELEREIERLKDLRPWTEHGTVEDDGLPVPRLEMAWEKGSFRSYQYRCQYRLVYRHLLNHIESVPLGETLVGGHTDPDGYKGLKMILPFRDGAHIKSDAKHLNLPAFVRWDDKVEKINADE